MHRWSGQSRTQRRVRRQSFFASSPIGSDVADHKPRLVRKVSRNRLDEAVAPLRTARAGLESDAISVVLPRREPTELRCRRRGAAP